MSLATQPGTPSPIFNLGLRPYPDDKRLRPTSYSGTPRLPYLDIGSTQWPRHRSRSCFSVKLQSRTDQEGRNMWAPLQVFIPVEGDTIKEKGIQVRTEKSGMETS
ncbi:hypothetical protein ACFE04_011227 [Oxalis oulophora]